MRCQNGAAINGPRLLSILILLLAAIIPKGAIALICYTCTTTLSPVNVEENAKLALRLFLNSVYELPPVHRFCSLEEDVEFKTVPTVQCSSANDECVKVRAESEGYTEGIFLYLFTSNLWC
jgi:hypothetical protein